VVRNEKENVLFCPCHQGYFTWEGIHTDQKKIWPWTGLLRTKARLELTNISRSQLTELTRTAIFV
jgi:hypothetical protein